MNRMTESVVESSSAAGHGPPGSQPGAEGSRTLLKRCLLDTVLPAFTLLVMSVLTITMIVVVVTTVAHAGWLTPPTYVSVDPWSSLYSDSEVASQAGVRYLDPAVSASLPSGAQADAGYVAAELPK
ncbi:MAG TPA: hypothetical protein PKH24_01230 [Sedimentisphaerales bacterium]|jgi:hypothetical protein|nr:hypothetical protein [Sedimentisphaerales bacterium]HNU27849.1 hypothetical protein [Sedimentisphaerales bacterium]